MSFLVILNDTAINVTTRVLNDITKIQNEAPSSMTPHLMTLQMLKYSELMLIINNC